MNKIFNLRNLFDHVSGLLKKIGIDGSYNLKLKLKKCMCFYNRQLFDNFNSQFKIVL